jgi:hypothetical protein
LYLHQPVALTKNKIHSNPTCMLGTDAHGSTILMMLFMKSGIQHRRMKDTMRPIKEKRIEYIRHTKHQKNF